MGIENTIWDRIRNAACIVILVAVFVFLGLNWSAIPDPIPAHYDAAGTVTRWGGKAELWILPAISVALYIGISIIERFPNVWNTGVKVTPENSARVYRILKGMLETLKLSMCACFAFITVSSALQKSLPIWFLPVFLLAILGPIVIYLVLLYRNR